MLLSLVTPAATIPRVIGPLCLAVVLALGAIWGSGPLIHDDLFFHLGTGRHVVEQHEVPTTDIFSFTRFGERWVSHEWGFGLLLYLVWSVAGFAGLIAMKALVVVAILALLFGLMLRRSELTVARGGALLAALLAVGLWAIRDQLILRASLVSSLFLLVLMLLVEWFDRSDRRLPFAAIVGLFLVWGNFHAEVLFGLFLLGVVTVEGLLARHVKGDSRRLPNLLAADPRRPWARLFTASLLVTLLNPNGYQVWLYPLRLAAFLSRRGDALEMGHFTGATPAAAAGFYLLLALLLMASLPVAHLERLTLTEAVTTTVFLVLSLRSHRFIFFFSIFALPVLARLAANRWARPSASRPLRQLRAVAIGVTMLVLAVAAARAFETRPPSPLSRHFPDGAVRFLQSEGIRPRMFNHQNYGGYLGWSLGDRVYWDGRNLLFASLMEETTASTLSEVVARWQLDALILTEREYAQLAEQIDASVWALVYWDDYAALYLLGGRAFEKTARAHRLEHLPPFGGVPSLAERALDPDWATAARRELDQVLRYEPRCQRALYFRGLLSLYAGHLDAAETELREALAAGPPNPYILDALARVLDRLGRPDEARQMRRDAIDAR